MTRYWFLEGWAKEELIQAWREDKIGELLEKLGLPNKTFAYGDSPISFEFEKDKVAYKDYKTRVVHITGRVRAHIDLGLLLLAIKNVEVKNDEEVFDGYTKGELAQRYEIQKIFEQISEEELEKIKRRVKRKLAKIMEITGESDRAIPFPAPKAVPYEEFVKEEFLTPNEVARRLGFSNRTVINWCNQGKIKAIKIGGFWRIPESEFHRLLQGLENWRRWHEKEYGEDEDE